jgi:hypothetical protein
MCNQKAAKSSVWLYYFANSCLLTMTQLVLADMQAGFASRAEESSHLLCGKARFNTNVAEEQGHSTGVHCSNENAVATEVREHLGNFYESLEKILNTGTEGQDEKSGNNRTTSQPCRESVSAVEVRKEMIDSMRAMCSCLNSKVYSSVQDNGKTVATIQGQQMCCSRKACAEKFKMHELNNSLTQSHSIPGQFVWDLWRQSSIGTLFVRVLWFSPLSIIPPMFCTHPFV